MPGLSAIGTEAIGAGPDKFSTIQGSVQAQNSVLSGNISLLVSLTGTSSAQSSSVTGTLSVFATITGTSSAQNSNAVGTLGALVTITGTSAAQSSSADGNITLVLSVPSVDAIRETEVVAIQPAGSAQAKWDGSRQFDKFGDGWWEWVIELRPFDSSSELEEAKDWSGFLSSLKGKKNTFTLGPEFDPGLSGQAAGETDLQVKSIDGSGTVVTIKNLPTNTNNVFKRGDWFSVKVSGGESELKKVMKDADSGGSGEADVDIWPPFRTDPSDGDPVNISNPKGKWRLAENRTSWSWTLFTQRSVTVPIKEAVGEL